MNSRRKKRERLYTIAKTMECPCSGDFVYLGEITQDSAKVALDAGHIMFSDRTVPAGSPLCYAYWVKAVDGSGNRSGVFPIPSAAEQAGIVCERLRDRTPPESRPCCRVCLPATAPSAWNGWARRRRILRITFTGQKRLTPWMNRC